MNPTVPTAALVTTLPSLSAALGSLTHRTLRDFSGAEIVWSIGVLVVCPLALGMLFGTFLSWANTRAARAMIAAALPMFAALTTFLAISNYVLDHLAFQSGGTVFLGVLSADLDRSRFVLVVAAAGSVSLGILTKSIPLTRLHVPRLVVFLVPLLPSFTLSLLLFSPRYWLLEHLSNGALAVLLSASLVLANVVLTAIGPMVPPTRSAA
jgi:hypothetical protein